MAFSSLNFFFILFFFQFFISLFYFLFLFFTFRAFSVFSKLFLAPILVAIAVFRFAESNGCGITSGDALEPEL